MSRQRTAATTSDREFGPDRMVVDTASVGVVWLLILGAPAPLGQEMSSLGSFVAQVLYLATVAAAAVLSAFAAIRTRSRVRFAWSLLLVSNMVWLASIVSTLYLARDDVPLPFPADLGYLLQHVIALPAVLVGLGVRVLSPERRLLDSLLMAAAVGAIAWQVAFGPLVFGAPDPLADSRDGAGRITFMYPVLSASIGIILVAALFARGRSAPCSLVIAASAFGVGALGDAGYAYLVAVDSSTGLSWMNVAWEAQAVLLGLAAFVGARRREEKAVHPRSERVYLPTLVAFLGAVVLFLADYVFLNRARLALPLLLLLGMLARQLIVTGDRTRLARELGQAALTDPLTSLRNRRFFDEQIDIEAEGIRRDGKALSLVLVDLDHFKNINDTYGHALGDTVLAEVAARLRQSVRATDVVCRYGGEEFVCILPGAREDDAVALAERMRGALGRTPVATARDNKSVMVTGSFGVATVDARGQAGPIDVDALIKRADRALYLAKANGRDRVVGSSSEGFAERRYELGGPV